MAEKINKSESVYIYVSSCSQIYNNQYKDLSRDNWSTPRIKNWERQLVRVMFKPERTCPGIEIGGFSILISKFCRRLGNDYRLGECDKEIPELKELFYDSRYDSEYGTNVENIFWNNDVKDYIPNFREPACRDIYVIKEFLSPFMSPEFQEKRFLREALAIYESAYVATDSFMVIPIPEGFRDADVVAKFENHFKPLGFVNADNRFLIKDCQLQCEYKFGDFI